MQEMEPGLFAPPSWWKPEVLLLWKQYDGKTLQIGKTFIIKMRMSII